jgi:DNA-binding NtrC family response regulator
MKSEVRELLTEELKDAYSAEKQALRCMHVIEHIRSRVEVIPVVLMAAPLSTHDPERITKLSALNVLEKPLAADALLSYLCSISAPPKE